MAEIELSTILAMPHSDTLPMPYMSRKSGVYIGSATTYVVTPQGFEGIMDVYIVQNNDVTQMSVVPRPQLVDGVWVNDVPGRHFDVTTAAQFSLIGVLWKRDENYNLMISQTSFANSFVYAVSALNAPMEVIPLDLNVALPEVLRLKAMETKLHNIARDEIRVGYAMEQGQEQFTVRVFQA